MAKITIDIPDDKLEEFKAGFLKRHPIPEGTIEGVDEDGNPTVTLTGQPAMGPAAWFKQIMRNYLIKVYRSGKDMLASEAATPVYEEIDIT